jgi:hypothetical protein
MISDTHERRRTMTDKIEGREDMDFGTEDEYDYTTTTVPLVSRREAEGWGATPKDLRVCYWVRDDQQAEVPLGVGATEDEAFAAALKEAEYTRLDPRGGSFLIGPIDDDMDDDA